MGRCVDWSANVSSGIRAAAGAPGLHTKRRSSAGQIRQRRADEDSKFSAFDAARDQETVRGAQTILHSMAEGLGNGGENRKAFPSGSNHVRLFARTAHHSESDVTDCSVKGA